MKALSSWAVYASNKPLNVTATKSDIQCCESMYPLEAKSDSRIEQAANTEVMPAAVPSIVFSNISKVCA